MPASGIFYGIESSYPFPVLVWESVGLSVMSVPAQDYQSLSEGVTGNVLLCVRSPGDRDTRSWSLRLAWPTGLEGPWPSRCLVPLHLTSSIFMPGAPCTEQPPRTSHQFSVSPSCRGPPAPYVRPARDLRAGAKPAAEQLRTNVGREQAPVSCCEECEGCPSV